MFTSVKAYVPDGINGLLVEVEVCASKGLPSFELVGLATSAVKESKERVRSAINNSGFSFGQYKTVVNLAPADIKKEGSVLDLAIAVGYLTAIEQVPKAKSGEFIYLGELSLDGGLRRISGVMPMILSAVSAGYKNFIVPFENALEASFVKDANVYALKNLADVTNLLMGFNYEPISHSVFCGGTSHGIVDFCEIKGQILAKRGMEIAVSGAHNILMSGSPGTGKTMLAKCVTGIMPEMTFEEALEVTRIHSVAGLINTEKGIVSTRPFRSPHHTTSTYGLTGGGAKATPGEVSLAHNGVLFLDELPEYSRRTLESLRQPLEDGKISISRVNKSVSYPAHFMLIASMNPCPCGYFGSDVKKCTCNQREINAYRARISGPLLDRIDIFVEVDNIEFGEYRAKSGGETSEIVRGRVEDAREIQRKRFAGVGIYTNSRMSNADINKYCQIDAESETFLEAVFTNQKLSPRSASRILKTARTIADLAASDKIEFDHLCEAIQYKAKETI